MILRERILLGNGLVIELADASAPEGDLWKAVLQIRVEVGLRRELFDGLEEADFFWRLAVAGGRTLGYERRKVRRGVPRGRLAEVLNEMASRFKQTALPYLATEDFARNFVLSRLGQICCPALPRPV